MQDRAKGKTSLLAAAVVSACLLAACGGGGGGTRPNPPPLAPPPVTPPDTPPVVLEPDPAYSHHLAWTGAASAHAAGLTGAGVRIGIVDSGVNRNHPAMREDRVVVNLNYIDPASNNLRLDDVVGHGTAVAQIAAGMPFGRWPGGIAPGAQIVSARIINDKPPEDDGTGQGNEVDGALGLAPIHADLMRHGVRVMNNSWGGLYWTNAAATAPIAAEYRPFIVDHGGLVVFSTGNAGFADPSDTAALPSQAGTGGSRPAADLERGWLAVAALDAADPARLAVYSNACGVAMHYCLVAPGTVVFTGTDDAPDAPEYYQGSGTSFAAPIVSGAAALVWEAFPYFDNDLVRQTLLGTATDIGDPGVDAVFGYGRVDIARAVAGPARLDWGDLMVDFDGISSRWGNALEGQGALVKRGNGTLVLDASAGNAGGIRVEEGALHAHFYVSGDVAVERNASFGIGIAVDGDLRNSGRVELLEREGAGAGLTGSDVGGHYSQADGAVLALDIGQFLSPLTASLDGTLHVRGVQEGYTTSDREPVVSTTLGLDGRFDTMTWADSLFLEATLGYDDFAAWLDIERADVVAAAKAMAGMRAAGLSAAQRVENAFAGIDRVTEDPAGTVDDDLLRLAGEFQAIGDEGQAKAAFDSLSGESHALATTLTFDAIDMGRRALSWRVGQLQPGGRQAGAWKQSLGTNGAGTGIAGGGFQLDGWLMGSDQVLANGLVTGFAFGETRADGWVGGNRDRSRDRQTQASVYLGRLSADAYATGQLTTGRYDRDIERWLFAGADARTGVSSAYAGSYTSLGTEAGRRLQLGEWQLTPWLGVDHVRLHSDGFEEWGSGFGLRANAATLTRTQVTTGLRASRDWHGVRLHAWSEWQQTLQASGFDMQASFTGIDSWSPLPLAGAAKSGGLLGVGIDTWLGHNAQLSLACDQRFGPRGNERMGSVRYVLGF
ncbi:S8 family serine peptidase [Luteimonas sp. A611]